MNAVAHIAKHHALQPSGRGLCAFAPRPRDEGKSID
jgi:hypothetical protein